MSQTATRSWTQVQTGTKTKSSIPEGLWLRCPGCSQMIYRKQMEANLSVCPECGHHFRISASTRVEQLIDTGTFERLFANVESNDPLKFKDLKSYRDRLLAEQIKSGQTDAIIAGVGFIKGRQVALACMDLSFMMGSMGSVVGEVLTRTIEHATEHNLPLVIVSCSGGARMQESGLSLMQMAKSSAALARFDDAGGVYISVLTDPTTGGVTASYAMLGDVIIAEPEALIGFAGPRVIRQTIRQDLPEGFQRSEFLLECGMVDQVVPRHDMRNQIARLVDYAGG
ncbi:MAG: acetyl-CoA carboxylase carboxyltransferase subunit beta [Phycisphaera sp.]|nr:acetyl-CoA carboxylase carboxyltransferase subunit beta [Leptolyngbya sp. SIO3F4]RNC81505.1 MAG: acetyl-CoA carboxylase carboxyltransferase subunit beta [Phycisphaera sp.]